MSHARLTIRPTLRRLRTSLVAVAVAGSLGATSAIALAPAATVTLPVPAATEALPAPQPGAEVFPRPADGVYDITGGGFGHGIGMSQYGAHGAALEGRTTAQILAFYYPGTNLVKQAPPSLTVGITVDNDGVLTVAARPGLTLTIAGTSQALPTGPTRWRVRATGATANTCVVESYNGSWSTFRSGTICPVRFSSSEEGSVDVLLPTDQRVYRGSVSAVWRSSTKVATTNLLPMQSYLRSVVPSEMPPSWDPAALGAQAVAARTFAARRSNATSWYDTCDTTACQVYRGRGKRSTDGTITSYEYTSTNTAVTATDGQVLTFRFSDGVTRLATTMYSSSDGGYTAASGNGHDYLSAHSDPYDDVSINRRHAWAAQLPVTSLESRFGIHQVQRLQIRRRDGNGKWGGRVLDVRVEGITSGGAYTYVETSGNGIQSARPWPSVSTGLSSNYFTIASTTTGTVTRLAGSNRYATAAAVAARYPSGLEVVYVASGIAFPDALAGAARAAYNDGPLLLTHPTSLPSATREAMVRLNPNRVVVLGGENSVSESVAQALASLTRSGGMQRVWGPDRYATAASLAGFYATGPSVAYVASGQDYPDALAGAAIAGRDQVPILLTRATSLPSATADALRRLAPARIVVVGGPNAVSAGVLEQLKGLATAGSVARLAGVDRYGTAARVAAEYSSASSAYVASGQNFPDALAGAAIGGRDGAPLLLTRFDSLPAPTKDVLTRLRPNEAFLLGGLEVVTDSVKTAIRTAISG